MWIIYHCDQPQILRCEHISRQHPGSDPAEQALPALTVHQDYRYPPTLPGLGECKNFRQLVQCAKTTRKHYVGTGIFDKHDLATEKMSKIERQVLIFIRNLLVRQGDIQTYTLRLAGVSTLVKRLHHAETAPGDHTESGIGQQSRQPLSLFVIIIIG